jgi:hypothetical protein
MGTGGDNGCLGRSGYLGIERAGTEGWDQKGDGEKGEGV